jgi:3-dehydroquinate synthase
MKLPKNNKSYKSCQTQLSEIIDIIMLSSQLKIAHKIVFTKNLFSLENSTLTSVFRDKPILIVIAKSIDRFYGQELRAFIKKKGSGLQIDVMVLDCNEVNKTINKVFEICRRAENRKLERESQIIAIGGGICTDICGFAASIYRRGISCIKVPTTLVALIDAGIGTKNAINYLGKKNYVGTFYPPEYSIIDPTFLHTLPRRHIRCGLAESLKMGIICDKKLYQLISENCTLLLNSNFRKPVNIAFEIINRSILGMLNELCKNLYEVNYYKRKLDFGHTFSPYIETSSNYKILHGEAVAIDIAISCYISHIMSQLNKKNLEDILNLIEKIGLPIFSSAIEPLEMWKSLEDIVAHRNGHLNLVIPKYIGNCRFVDNIKEISFHQFSNILRALENKHVQNRSGAMVP